MNKKEIVLSLNKISKNFGHIQALRDISLDFFRNEITAIVGDNGAGKSTLIKILAGAEKPSTGTITLDNTEFKYLLPAKALQKGIVTVYQDLALVNSMDVSSNIFLGIEPLKSGFLVDKNTMDAESEALIKDLKINIQDIQMQVSQLSGGQRQALAIARAIKHGGKILILDEPTAAMGVKETQQIMELIKNLKGQGYTIIIISHNMQQVFALSDRICVLRQGELKKAVATKNTAHNEIVQYITGISEVGGLNARTS